MNFIQIAGFLGADPEERFTTGGKRVVTLRVATKVRQGKEDITLWWRANIWGDRFDKMIPYLKKGSAVIIHGEMSKPEAYVDKEGKTQVSLTMQAEIIKFSPFGKSSKTEGENSGFKPQNVAPQSSESNFEGEMAHYGSHSEKESSPYASDDLPF